MTERPESTDPLEYIARYPNAIDIDDAIRHAREQRDQQAEQIKRLKKIEEAVWEVAWHMDDKGVYRGNGTAVRRLLAALSEEQDDRAG